MLTYLVILFSYGDIDGVISDLFSKSPNDLSKGRQFLWLSALKGVDYNFVDFVFFGTGVGKVITELQKVYGVERILLHNDILSTYLEYGFIIFLAFLVSLIAQKRYYQKVLAVNLLILFFTDNVIIYQHVMITYFLIQSQLANDDNSSVSR
jgi:hypothetical protein